MLGKLAVVFVLCQVIVFTCGGILRPQSTDDQETCTKMYVNCTTNEECCDFMRCLDFGTGSQCLYGTDNPQVPKPGGARQPPLDLIDNLGCELFGQTCEEDDDCCSPFICHTKYGICDDPPVDQFGLGYPGYNGAPGK